MPPELRLPTIVWHAEPEPVAHDPPHLPCILENQALAAAIQYEEPRQDHFS